MKVESPSAIRFSMSFTLLALLAACGSSAGDAKTSSAPLPAATPPDTGNASPPPDSNGAARSDAGSASAATSSVASALAARVDRALDGAIAENRIVGGVVVVVRDGKVVYHRAAGFADREAKRPMTEDSVFRFASVTKPIVAATALALVEQRKLDLDDPVSRWIPDFTPKLASGERAAITVRQLLTHTSGLGYALFEREGGPYHRANVSDGLDQPGLSFDENRRRLVTVPLLAAPGKAFHYGLSTDVLGEVVARAAKSSLPEAVARYVTTPLAMRDASFGLAPDDPRASRLVAAYADGKPAPVRMTDGQKVPLFGAFTTFAPSRALDPKSYPSGGAGMVGTAADLVTFLEAVRTHDTRLLRPETIDLATKNQIGALRSPEIGGEGWGFGYFGAVLLDRDRDHSPLTNGAYRWGGAYGHSWYVDPAARTTIVLLTNTAFEGMIGKLPNDLVAAVYD